MTKIATAALRQYRALRLIVAGDQRITAVIRETGYGADIELSNGDKVSLWEFAITEPIMDSAERWARSKGASLVRIERADSAP